MNLKTKIYDAVLFETEENAIKNVRKILNLPTLQEWYIKELIHEMLKDDISFDVCKIISIMKHFNFDNRVEMDAFIWLRNKAEERGFLFNKEEDVKEFILPYEKALVPPQKIEDVVKMIISWNVHVKKVEQDNKEFFDIISNMSWNKDTDTDD